MSYCVKIISADADEVRTVGKFVDKWEAMEWIKANADRPEYDGAMFAVKEISE